MKMFFFVKVLLFILLCCEERVIGMVTLTPMTVALVCRVGDPLQLTCTASVQFIRWSVFQVNEQDSLEEAINPVQINSRDPAQQMSQRVVNSATFIFTRSSAEHTTPLVSTLSIDSINTELNGTVVRCSEVGGSMTSASNTIQVIDINHYTPILNITSEEYNVSDNVTITVEWMQQAEAVYSAKISPMAPSVLNGNTSLQLILQYNTEYNLSVVADNPCGTNATASITLNFTNCGDLELQVLSTNSGSVPKIDGSDDILPIEENTVRFSCPPGLALIGPNSTTCTENGEWEPDPSGLMCIVTCEDLLLNQSVGSSSYILNYSEPALVGTTVGFNCSEPNKVLIGPNTATCMDDGQWIPDPNQLQITCKVSCDTPETDKRVQYSSYNSTLEGSTVKFRCINMQLSTEIFTSMCHGNASWVPDPVNHCTALRSDGERLQSDTDSAVVGGILGALVVILLMLLTALGIVIFIKKDSLWRCNIHRKSLEGNVELSEEHIVHEQQNENTAENIVYAIIGPFSSGQSQTLETLKLDDDIVGYAKINYSVMAQNRVPVSPVERAVDEESDMSLNLDSLLIHLQNKVTQKWHQFGVALGVEKDMLDRFLNYPPEQSIVETLDHWLRNCDCQKRNWKEIARALRQIGCQQLAKEIESIDKLEPDNVPDIALKQFNSDLNVDESPPPIPPKKRRDFPEDCEHGEVIIYNRPA